MAIDHNIDDFAKALSEAPQEFEQEVLDPLGRDVNVWFGQTATRDYMTGTGGTYESDPQPRARASSTPGKLRRVSNTLAQAVRSGYKDTRGGGGRKNSKTIIGVQEKGLIWTKIIGGTEDLPYAAIHEKGGKIRTSQRMEAFFWAKAYEVADTLPLATNNYYRILALATKTNEYFTIPARPYAEPALRDITPKAVDRGEELIVDFLEKRT